MVDGVDSLLDPIFDLLLDPGDDRPVRVGGLRGGWLELRGDRIAFHRVVYVPGVAVSGRIDLREAGFTARFRVAGRAAARGTLRITESGAVTGRLGGRRVKVRGGAAAAAANRGRRTVARLRALRRAQPLIPVPRSPRGAWSARAR
jgi:hypothetical protein